MTVTITVSGDNLSFERDVAEATVQQLVQLATGNSDPVDADSAVHVALSGEDLSFENKIPEQDVPGLLSAVYGQGENGQQMAIRNTHDPGLEPLPADFVDQLSDRQEALIHVLLEVEEWTESGDCANLVEDEYGISVKGGRGVAGILTGMTKKWGEEFRRSVVDGRELPDGTIEHRIPPERKPDLRAVFGIDE